MVNTFSFIRTPKIIFGAGKVEALPGLVKDQGIHILIITGSKSYLLNPLTGKILSTFEKEGFVLHFDKIEREPSPDDIDRIAARYRPVEIDVVIGIGGGSVIDSGKAVSAMLPLEGLVCDYLEGVGTKSHPGIKKYYIAIPTTSGTGSEATANAVLSKMGTNGYKRSLRHENLVPDIAIVDPGLTITCPPYITAASGMDAFTQLLESYLSIKSCPLSDSLAFEGIRHIHTYLCKAVNDGDNIEARSGMAYAALLSGITLANAGLGLVHGFAPAIGSMFIIPHGVVCGTLMGVVNRHNVNMLIKQRDMMDAHEKYSTLGKMLSGAENKTLHWYMQFVADYIDDLTQKLHIQRLGEFGITEADLERIAYKTDHKANPVKFEKEQLVEMLKERL